MNSISLAKVALAFALVTTVGSGAFAEPGPGHGGGGGGGHSSGGGGGHSSSGGHTGGGVGHPPGGGQHSGGGVHPPASGGNHGGGQVGGNHGGNGGNHGGNGGNHGGNGGNHGGNGGNHGGNGGNHGGNGGNHGGNGHGGGHVPSGHNGVGHGSFKGQKDAGFHGPHGEHVVQRNFSNDHGHHMFYAERGWGGRPYYAFYAHGWGYNPWFWGWYWGPWTPWPYVWGWPHYHWYGYWSWYWTPWPVVTYNYQWIAMDHLRQSSQDAYDLATAEQEQVVSTPTNSAINSESMNQIAQQDNDMANKFKSGQAIDIKDTLEKPNYLYEVNETMSVLPSNSTVACKLHLGDWLRVATKPQDTDQTVSMVVTNAKFGSCPAGTVTTIAVEDVQEMLNANAERVQTALHNMQDKKGQNGPVEISELQAPQPQTADVQAPQAL